MLTISKVKVKDLVLTVKVVHFSERHRCWFTGSPLALFRVQHSAILYSKLLSTVLRDDSGLYRSTQRSSTSWKLGLWLVVSYDVTF